MGDGLRLGEHRREIVIVARLHTRHLSCIDILFILKIDGIVDRCKREIVEHLGRLHHQVFLAHTNVLGRCLQFLHGHHGLAALLHGVEINHSRSLVLVVVERLHGDLGQESQRSLRAYYRMGNDIERIVVGNQRTEIQSCHILDGILFTDSLGKRLVGPHTVAQVLDFADEFRMRLAERFLALLVASVEHSSIGKDDTSRDEHAVAVGMHAAVHSRSVVTHNAANHSRANRSGIGREHPAERSKNLVHP